MGKLFVLAVGEEAGPVKIIRKHCMTTSALLLSIALVCLAGCHHWVPLSEPLGQAVEERDPGTVRVWTSNTSRVVLSPTIRRDTLSGLSRAPWGELKNVAIPISQVRRIEERRTQTLKTVLLVYGLASVVWMGTCIAGLLCLGAIVEQW